MLTVLKAVLIVTVVGVCSCNKRKNITSPERLQRDVLDDYDIQAQSLFGPLPLAYNQPTGTRDPYGSGLLPSRGGYDQVNYYGRKYGTRPSSYGTRPSSYGTRPSSYGTRPWGGQIQRNRNTDYRLHDDSEETGTGFSRPLGSPHGSIQLLPLMSPGLYRPQQQNYQPIAPHHYSTLPLKGSSIIQDDE